MEDGKLNADATGTAQDSRVFSSARYLAANIQKAPVYVIPCIAVDQLPVDPPRHVWPGLMGSILPAVWTFQLASTRLTAPTPRPRPARVWASPSPSRSWKCMVVASGSSQR